MAVVQSEGALVAAHKQSTRIVRGLELHSGDFTDYAALYRTQPNVRTVNGFLARNIAQLGLHAFEASDDDERRRLGRRHPLSRFIRQPNPYITRYAWTNYLVHDLGVYDVFCALKVRNPIDGVLRAFRIPPYMFEPIGDSWIAPEGIKLLGNRERPEFARDQIIYIHGYNPVDARTGISPLESLRRILIEEEAAGKWREQLWRNSARQTGIITRPVDASKWSDTARRRFSSDWQALYAGDGALAGATPILEEGMTWNAASFSAKESEYLDARRLAREEVAASYFISPLFVGILDHANFSNVSEQHKHLYQDTLGPRCVELEEEFELQVFPEFTDVDPDTTYLEFNLAEKLKGTFEEQATVLQTLVGAPVMTRNEGRSRLNLPNIDGGDQLVTPLNVLIGGQASPRDSAPSGTAARRKRKRATVRKSVDDLPRDALGWHAKHTEVLAGFFDRQKESVVSRIGAGQHPDEAWDTARWDTELETDLLALSTEMASDLAGQVADRFGGAYDAAVAHDYLAESSRIAAENINATTKTAVTDAWTAAAVGPAAGLASRRSSTKDASLDDIGDDEEIDPVDAVAGVFVVALAARVDELATSRVTSVGNFARHEGARQSGVTGKVWVVNSSRSRHPDMNGETVGLDDTFSNGGRWPGDPGAGVSETAGCTCSLDFTTEEL